jgi:hypothetical protein
MTELSKNIKSDLQAQSDLLIKMNYKIYKQSRLHMMLPLHLILNPGRTALKYAP